MTMDTSNPYGQAATITLHGRDFRGVCGALSWEAEDGGDIPKELSPFRPGAFIPETCATGDSFAEGVEVLALKIGAKITHLKRIPESVLSRWASERMFSAS